MHSPTRCRPDAPCGPDVSSDGPPAARRADRAAARRACATAVDPRPGDRRGAACALVIELYGAGLERIVALVGRRGAVLARAGRRRAGRQPAARARAPSRRRSRRVSNGRWTRVRPYLAHHGGDVELLDVDERGRRRAPAAARELRRVPVVNGHAAARRRARDPRGGAGDRHRSTSRRTTPSSCRPARRAPAASRSPSGREPGCDQCPTRGRRGGRMRTYSMAGSSSAPLPPRAACGSSLALPSPYSMAGSSSGSAFLRRAACGSSLALPSPPSSRRRVRRVTDPRRPARSPSSPASVAARRRPRRRAGERCELCAEPIADEHAHLVDVGEPRRCCAACRGVLPAVHVERAGGGRYRAVPDRYLSLPRLRSCRRRSGTRSRSR